MVLMDLKFMIYPIEDDVNSWASYDPTLTGLDGENYAFIGQAYLNYEFGNTNVKVGRQRLDTPLIGSDDARMLPNLFEAAVLTNTDIRRYDTDVGTCDKRN